MSDHFEAAIILATGAHAGQPDKQGQPYILHPLAVMLSGETEAERIVGVLHDTVEDTDITLDEIQGLFGAEVADAVDALTRRPGESYGDFIFRARRNEVAKRVKVNDIRHNLSRMNGLRPSEAKGLTAKYRRALAILFDIVNTWDEAAIYEDRDIEYTGAVG